MNVMQKILGAAATALAFIGAPAQAQVLYQGVTFEMQALDSNTLQLSISDALTGGTGNWSDINFLSAFEIKGFGTDATSANVTSGPGTWAVSTNNNLANAGCTSNGDQKGACFQSSPATALTDSMVWTIDFFGVPDLTTLASLHLKVNFFESQFQSTATGDLLSQDISITTPVPEPSTYALMLAGLAAIGFMVRRRRAA
jgi:hypothetical protein